MFPAFARLPAPSITKVMGGLLDRFDFAASHPKDEHGRAGAQVEDAPSSACVPSLSLPWIKERATVLQGICTGIEERRARGESVSQALRHVACRGKRFASDPRRRPHLSRSTLRREYYHWRRSGKGAECFRLAYAPDLPAVSNDTTRRFVLACALAGVTSTSQAWRVLSDPKEKLARIWNALPQRTRAAIRKAHSERRAAEKAAKQAVARMQAELMRKLRRDAKRAKRLMKLAESIQ